ncbi:MAG: N-6 DNA methylase [Patescibacteria group bacterium]
MQNQAKEKIKALAEKYELVRNSGKLKSYTEEETKKDLILPLLEALGWNVFDKNEVSAEENIISSGRVDYGIYLNGRVKFYLEAKKLSADLHREEFAHQSIRYSWNKGVTWAVLTDFESLKVFNAQEIDKSLVDKLLFEIPYAQYLERFDEQLSLLSKEAFEKGLIDKYAEDHGKKLQKISVSALLYKDLQKARDLLTKSLAAWNEKVPKDLLDEGVQKLLDRLIFLRVAEDRGVEPPTLIPMIRQWQAGGQKESIYKSMIKRFREFDKIYNSNLFSPHPFEDWEEYDDTTEKVINILYGKKGYYEYDFKAMPADVLGTVYENYLGYRLSQSKKGMTVDKDAKKRKEQGIYYTPSFVVDYIVKNALCPILAECKSIADLKKIKVLDPACGSGSFLVKALEAINDKYKDFGADGGVYTKLQILTENIYGVDLDEQAVEIARLNLLINALDSKIKLPSLAKNIKNGNSLISGSDEELKKYFGKNFRDKKPFNWQEEFPEVFAQGGFDVIIGNPPYIKEFVSKSVFDGLHNSPYYQGKMDIWTMFGCVAIDLLKNGGILSFIAPNNWITNAGASIFRDKILKDGELKTFIDFGDYKVFEQAGIQTMIFAFEKKKSSEKYTIDYLKIVDKNIAENKLINDIFGRKTKIKIEPSKLIGGNITFAETESNLIFDKTKSKKNFELTEKEVGQGIVAAPDKYFLEKNAVFYNKDEQKFLKRFYTASGKYKSGESTNYIFYISDKNFSDKKIKNYPNIEKHFKQFKKNLKEAKIKYGTPDKPYFYLHREREEKFFNDGPKIICGVRVKYPSFYYTEEEYYGSRALNFIKTERINLKYLTGILNSKLIFFWLKNKGKQLGDLLQIDKGPLMEIPICISNIEQQKQIILLVDKMLQLNKELRKTPENSNKWNSIKEEIAKTDKKIDEEVYKLYGLEEEEVEIIEQ